MELSREITKLRLVFMYRSKEFKDNFLEEKDFSMKISSSDGEATILKYMNREDLMEIADCINSLIKYKEQLDEVFSEDKGEMNG